MNSYTESITQISKRKSKKFLEKEFTFKKGPFSRTEKFLVDKALSKVLQEQGIFYDVKEKKKNLSIEERRLPRNFWKEVASYVPSRTVESIYDHARRRLSPRNYQGKWTDGEITKLEKLIEIYGQKWTKIGSSLNRLPGACYDKWRDVLKNGNHRKKGKWTQEERCKLVQLVTIQATHEYIHETYVNKFIRWTFIAEKLGSRSYLQCRNEWARFFIPGSKVKLSLIDGYKLIQTMFSSQINDETEVKWGHILSGVPAHKVYSKWRSLCRKFIKDNRVYDQFRHSFRTIVSIVRNSLSDMFKNKSFKN